MSRSRVLSAVLVSALVAGVASATPPTMDPIAEVIDWASIGTAVSAAGATVLGIVFAISIGFRLVHKLKARVTRAV